MGQPNHQHGGPSGGATPERSDAHDGSHEPHDGRRYGRVGSAEWRIRLDELLSGNAELVLFAFSRDRCDVLTTTKDPEALAARLASLMRAYLENPWTILHTCGGALGALTPHEPRR